MTINEQHGRYQAKRTFKKTNIRYMTEGRRSLQKKKSANEGRIK